MVAAGETLVPETDDGLEPGIPLVRVQVLADVIFASAMTIMVLGIDLPAATDGGVDLADLRAYLVQQYPQLLTYFATFVVVAVYWLKHLQQFAYLRATNVAHLWMQLLYLLFLVLLPFSNALSTKAEHPVVSTIAGVNLIAMGLLALVGWVYASGRDRATGRRRLINDEVDDLTALRIRDESLTEPLVVAIAVPMAWIWTPLYDIVLLLIPMAFIIQQRVHRRRMRAR